MKRLLLLLLLAVFITSCGNEIKVKLIDNETKLALDDYDKVYSKGDTLMLYNSGSSNSKWKIANTGLTHADDYPYYYKAVVLSVK